MAQRDSYLLGSLVSATSQGREAEVHWVISSDAVAMQSPKGICKILFEIRSAVKTNSQTTIKYVCMYISFQSTLLREAPPAISIYP